MPTSPTTLSVRHAPLAGCIAWLMAPGRAAVQLLFALSGYLAADASSGDWLVNPVTTPVSLRPWSSSAGDNRLHTSDGDNRLHSSGLELSNGLISRRFVLQQRPASGYWATWDFVSHLEDSGETSLLRSLTPETVVTLDGVEYPVGGLIDASCVGAASMQCKTPAGAFMNRSTAVIPDPTAFRYVSHRLSAPEKPFAWTPGTRGSPPNVQWPPVGQHLTVTFQAPPGAPPAVAIITVEVHYEMYVGHPILTKWISLSTNATAYSRHPNPQSSAGAAAEAAAAQPLTCSAVGGCSQCPGAVYMRECSTAAPAPGGESQNWAYIAANKSLVNRGMCLSVAGADHGSVCPHLVACNASDISQQWDFSTQNGYWGPVRSLDASALVCSGPSPPGCCAGVTANRKDAGAWWNLGACSSEPSQQQFVLAGTHLIEIDSLLCAAAKPPHSVPSPSPAPPGPPGPPAPPMVATLGQIQVETLALNQPYSPLPFQAYRQSDAKEEAFAHDGLGPDPRYKGDGKLHVELEYEYSDVVRWGYSAHQFSGASEPVMVRRPLRPFWRHF